MKPCMFMAGFLERSMLGFSDFNGIEAQGLWRTTALPEKREKCEMDKINVVLLIDNMTATSFQKYCSKKGIQVAASTHDADVFIEKMSAFRDSIAVVDTLYADVAAVSKVVSFLAGSKLKFVVICKNAKEGFVYLSKGALEMYIRNENFADEENINALCVKIKSAENQYLRESSRILKYTGEAVSDKIILIGSSTGGTETVLSILKELPENIAPIVVVQHMPPVFTKLYAQRLDEICKMSVREASDGDALMPGLALIAPGDLQTRLVKRNGKLLVECVKGEKVSGHAPSVDVLFYSAAQLLGKKAIGVILTGMGSDGAKGLLDMRSKGAFTIGQDQESSVVYGMPKVAFDIGGVSKQAAFKDIPKLILENL